MIDKNLREEMIQVFIRKKVLFAVIFGSFARNEATPISDIDIGVFFPKDLSKFERSNLHLEIISNIQRLIPEKRVDVINLNDAPLGLRYRVISDGIVIFNTNEVTFCDFKEKTWKFYWDFQPIERFFATEILER